MEFIERCINYLKRNPDLFYILVAVAAAILVLLIAIIAVSVRNAKRKKAAKAAEQAETAPAQEEVAEPAPVVEEVAEPTPVVEEVAEPAPVVEEVAEPAPVVEEVAKPAPVVEEVAEPAPVVEEVAEPAPVVEEVAEPAPAQEEVVAEQKPEKPKAKRTRKTPAKKTAEAPVEETPAAEEAPASVEETPQANEETAATATKSTRYAGKWIICKMISEDENGEVLEEEYFFELRASNGELLLSSEEYTSQSGAVSGIKTHKTNIEKGNFRVTLSKKGDYIFKLLNAKNTLLCTGANYPTKERCERAVESVKRFAATAVLQAEVDEIRVTIPADTEEPAAEFVDNGYNGKWIIFSKSDDQVGTVYYFELFASNGEKLLSSEEYTTYEGAINGVATHKANIEKGNFRIALTKRGDFIFKLLSGNGQLLCLGEHYKTKSRCESAVESVKRFSKSAQIYKYSDLEH